MGRDRRSRPTPTTIKGDVNTWGIVFEPPPELAGKINVVPEMVDILSGAVMYVGGEPCTDDKAAWRKVRDLLVAAKPKWIAMNYGTVDSYAKGDFLANAGWNGAAFRARLQEPGDQVRLSQGRLPDLDGQCRHPRRRQERRERQAVQNFIMDPENAALISAFARYANGIKGSEQFMPADMQGAPELTLPEGNKGVFIETCPPEVNEMMTRIWTELQK